MMQPGGRPSGPMSGRRAEAARNDGLILVAAREVFLADPGAPIAAVAERAGVGISALYRRYGSKDGLLAALTADALERFAADLQTALDDDGDPWDSYVACLERVVDGGSQALAQQLAGSFESTPELGALAGRAGDLYERLHRRTRRAGVLRADVSPADIILVLESVMLLDLPGDPDVTRSARQRQLALMLQALHDTSAPRLPGRPVTNAVLASRWQQ